MAAGLALLARDRAEINISFQMLLCPMIDSRNITPSSYRITDNRIWNRDCNSRAWAAYLGKENTSHGISPYAAPSLAKNLKNLPPTYIAVGELDLFVDENIEYAKRLVEVGVTTELKIFPGGFHGFEYLVPEAKLSRYARKTHFDRLRQAFLC